MKRLRALAASPSPDQTRGDLDRPFTLIEYGDYKCRFCGAAYPIAGEMRTAPGADLAFVYRHFPLANVHLHAERAAEAAEADGAQRKFWAMHDQLPTSGRSRR